MDERFARAIPLIGEDGLKKLADASVIVFGVGGVGGHLAEALARCGVGKITLVDSDVVDITNINRQAVAATSTVGMHKTDVMRARILDINPDAAVTALKTFYLPENADTIPLGGYDFVADAIDTVAAKVELAVRAQQADVPIISCMGAGNKLDPTSFRVADIYSTTVCPLAKVMRRELKKRGVTSLLTVYSTEPPAFDGRTPASIAFSPAVAGLIMASEIVKRLCGK